MNVYPRAGAGGWIEVITGSMFSGKSEELIRRVRRAEIARQKVQVFKPQLDSRFSQDYVVSHSDIRYAAQNVASARELLEAVRPDTEVVAIDEGQFFDQELPMICSSLADSGRRVIVAGLDQDYLGKPAKMETGLVVQVPAFINEGDVIRIDTSTGSYVERAK